MEYKVLISEEDIAKRVKELGKEISQYYGDEELLVVGLLKGSYIFVADLTRALSINHEVDFMVASSYGKSQTTSGNVKIIMDLNETIDGKNVLLVEDLIDTGHTLSEVKKILSLRKPKSLRVVTLLNKPSKREKEVELDWCGFEIPDEFVFGVGMDYEEKYRGLKDLVAKIE